MGDIREDMPDSPNLPEPPLDVALFDRYLANVAIPSERATVERWLAANPAHGLLLAVARTGYQTGLSPEIDVERALARNKQGRVAGTQHAPRHRLGGIRGLGGGKVGKGIFPPDTLRDLLVQRGRGAMWLGALAVALVAVGLVANQAGHKTTPVLSQRYSTLPGQQRRMALEDGSQVILAPATTIDVRRDTVILQGEAYFSIVPHANRPFVVRTANAVVHVLGTRFAVRQYANEANSNVAVDEGRVSLRATRQVATAKQTILTAQMVGRVTDSGVVIPPGATADEYTGWIHGRLVFDQTPLNDVMIQLSRAYGADIRILDSALAKEPLTITVTITEKALPQILDVIGLATGTRYTRSDTVFTLIPARRVLRAAPQLKRIPQPERQYGQ